MSHEEAHEEHLALQDMVKDAARYRFIRTSFYKWYDAGLYDKTGEELDKAIDEAMNEVIDRAQ